MQKGFKLTTLFWYMINKYLLFLSLFNAYPSIDGNILNNSKVSVLKTHLLTNYRSDVIPNRQEPLNMSIGLAFRAFNNIDQKEGIVLLNVWLRYWWRDDSLKWNKSHWNISSLTFRTDPGLDDSIWTPDIYLYNTAENPLENLKWSNAMIEYTGEVLWSRPGMIQSTCSFDMTDFPYDRQVCDLKLGSWSYTGEQLVLTEGSPSIDLTNYQKNEEWELEDVSHKINAIKYECCDHKYYDTTFTITLKRLSGYYETNIIIPTFSTASLILVTILIPWDSGERISFAVTVMLSIIVFLLILSDTLPKSNQLPLLSRMIMGLTFFALFGVLFTVLISALNSYKKNKLKGKNEIDNPVVKMLYNVCNRLCIINGTCINNKVYPIEDGIGNSENVIYQNRETRIGNSNPIEDIGGNSNPIEPNNLNLTITNLDSRSLSYIKATDIRRRTHKSGVSGCSSESESDSESELKLDKNKRVETKIEKDCDQMISKLEYIYSITFLITFLSLCIAMFSSKI